jgi:hypothetical protein
MFCCLVLFNFLHFFMLFNMQCLVQTVNCGPILPQLILFRVGTEWVLKTEHIQNEKKNVSKPAFPHHHPSPILSSYGNYRTYFIL